MILLLDADILVYQAACKNQEDYIWDADQGIESHVADVEGAKEALDKEVASIMATTKCTEVIMALSSSTPNFRYSVLPTYKHNRKNLVRPLLREALNQYVIDTFPHRRKPNLEGDDIIGILMTMSPGKYLASTSDKDLRQIPGKHYNFQTEHFFEVSEAEGDLWFYTQVLTGDTADGYKGCPGIGNVRAEKLLAGAEDPWAVIVEAYESKGLTEDDALQQARVARILRNSDYNHKLKEPILWSPNKMK